jgi:hypothetical protein
MGSWLRRGAAGALALVLLGLGAPGFAAALPRSNNSVALAVSAPSQPVNVEPGQSVQTWLRVLNPGSRAVTVTVTDTRLALGSDGHASFLSGPDPTFGQHIHLDPRSPITVAADGYRQIVISIAVPRQIQAGAYLVGFLVTPVITGPGVHVVNQIGALVPLNVLGPTNPRLSISLRGPGWLDIASTARLTLRTSNASAGGTIVYGEIFTHGTPDGPNLDLRIPPELLPGHVYRDNSLRWSPPLGIGLYRVNARVVYHLTPARTTELDAQTTVLLVTPLFLLVLAGVLLLFAGGIWWRRRTRRAARSAIRAGTSAGGEQTAVPPQRRSSQASGRHAGRR